MTLSSTAKTPSHPTQTQNATKALKLPRHIPLELEWSLQTLADQARAMGVVIQAGRGTGKSRLIGRVLAWQDAVRGYPTILLDPTGGSLGNFLDKVLKLLKKQGNQAAEFEKRLVYLDVSGKSGYTLGFPLYYRLGQESLHSLSQRFADAVIITNPQLQAASIEGANRIRKLATYTGMILFALGCQITEAHSLLTEPEKWKPLFGKAIRAYPEVKEAIAFFESEYMSLGERERLARLDAFTGKTMVFNLDPASKAMFGAPQAFSWAEVETQRKIVLLDFSKELDLDKRRFKMFWIFSSLVEYIKQRGIGKSLTPIALYVDELTAMLNLDSVSGGEAFATYLDELINIHSRNSNLWFTVAFQQWFQLPEKLRQTLLKSGGSLLLGAGADLGAAKEIAEMVWEYDPFLTKKVEPILMQFQGNLFEAGERTIEYSIEEQLQLHAQKLLRLNRFQFLARLPRREGEMNAPLQHLTIENLDRGQWVREEQVAQAYQLLARHTGQAVEALTKEIDLRRKHLLQSAPTPPQKAATIKEYGGRNNPRPLSIQPVTQPQLEAAPQPERNPTFADPPFEDDPDEESY